MNGKGVPAGPRLILASSSPRRSSLLRQIGLQFDIEPSHEDESVLGTETAEESVRRIAESKADAIASRHVGTDTVVLAADTLVVINDEVLGKPANALEAQQMLRRLQGRSHRVVTAYSVVDCSGGQRATRIGRAEVTFRPLSDDEIQLYISTGEPLDKAGGYGIQGQGALLVERVEGDFYAVVGLPLCGLGALLAEFGIGTFAGVPL